MLRKRTGLHDLEARWVVSPGGRGRSAIEPISGAGQLDVVLDEHAVVEHGQAGRERSLPSASKRRGGIDDVIRLPFAGRAADVANGGYWP